MTIGTKRLVLGLDYIRQMVGNSHSYKLFAVICPWSFPKVFSCQRLTPFAKLQHKAQNAESGVLVYHIWLGVLAKD